MAPAPQTSQPHGARRLGRLTKGPADGRDASRARGTLLRWRFDRGHTGSVPTCRRPDDAGSPRPRAADVPHAGGRASREPVAPGEGPRIRRTILRGRAGPARPGTPSRPDPPRPGGRVCCARPPGGPARPDPPKAIPGTVPLCPAPAGPGVARGARAAPDRATVAHRGGERSRRTRALLPPRSRTERDRALPGPASGYLAHRGR